jgi:hypothetical protein
MTARLTANHAPEHLSGLSAGRDQHDHFSFTSRIYLVCRQCGFGDAAHLAKINQSSLVGKLNTDLVAKHGMRMLNVTYYGKRNLTSGSKNV